MLLQNSDKSVGSQFRPYFYYRYVMYSFVVDYISFKDT